MNSAIFGRTREFAKDWCNSRRSAIWTAAMIAFLVRIGVSVALKTYEFKDHWQFGFEWGRIANWLLETNMYTLDGTSPTTITDPLYVFIIAAFFYVFGSFTTTAAIALIVFQSLLCGLTTWAIFVLGERVYGPLEARVASLLFAFYPASIFFTVGRIDPSSLTIPLLCVVFLLTFRLPDFPRARSAVIVGTLMGLLLLNSSKLLSLMAIIPLWLLWVAKKQRARMILVSVILLGSATLVMLPWGLRNSAVEGQATFTKTGFGLYLWAGNGPGATGYSLAPIEEPRLADHVYLQMAASWIANHPKDFVVLTLKRIIIFWSVIPHRVTMTDIFNGSVFMIVMGLAVVGAFWPGKKPERVWLLLLFIALFPILFYVTEVAYYRHRYHIEPFIIILTSRGIHRLWPILANFMGIPLWREEALKIARS